MPASRFLVISLFISLLLPGCGLLPELEDETKDWSASKFYTEAKAALDGGDYETAIKHFEGLEARYPFGRYAQQAQLEVAYAYYKYDEPESAIAASQRFIKLHPRHPNVDYAYYLKGLINFNRGASLFDRFIPADPSQRDPGAAINSFKDFAELTEKFPESKYAEDARLRMIYLRNNLAKYEVHVARYYMKREAYVAVINRTNYVIEKYQRTPAVRDALEIQIAAYRTLGLDDLAADAQRVLELNLAKGVFANLEQPAPKKTWGQRFWDYLKLDE